jgi:LuxR family maltose regulon positive regulatory protein
LKTKLYVPQSRGRLVDRPRLTARLQEGLARKLTLISAPPGFGKSSVLLAWRATPAGQQFPLAWLSLDEADNDPARFWVYVIAALMQLQPGVGQEAQELLQSARSVPIAAVLQLLINDLAEIAADFALVLDDYHLIEAAPIHEGIAFLLEHMPPQMHLVLTTRADPPLPLSRLRARDALVEIRVKDLRFTAEEAIQFLREVQGLELAEAEIAALTARTEGWVTGLQLAALSLRATEDVSGFVAALAGQHRYIVDYLMEEVLLRQPEPVQRFLLNTAVLPRLSGPLCDAVTGQPGSQAILERLEQANLFTVALDPERRWFRYHQLMSAVLRGRLQQSQPEALAAICERASAWFEAEGMREEAIRMALEGRQFERAADLLVMAADDLWRRGESETIRSYMKGLPGALVRQRADLALIRTRLDLVVGDWKAIEEALTDAEAALQGAPSGELAAYRSVLARVQNDLPTAVAQAEAALALLPDHPVSWGPVAAMSLAMAQILAGGFAAASESLVRLERLAQAVGDAYYASLAVYIQGELAETQGHLQYAYETFQRAERISRTRSGLMPSAGPPRIGMGRVLLEWNRLAEAEAHIDEGLRIGRATSHLDTLFRGFIAKVELRIAQGDLAGADALLLEMDESIPAAKPPQVDLLVGVARAQIYLAQGRLEAVATWGRQCEAVAGSVPVAFDAVALTLADLAVKAGRPEQAIAHLAPILARAERLSLVGVQVRGNILLALAHQALGESAQAQAAIRRAVSLGRPEGYIQSFRGGGAPLAFLLAQVRPTAPEYVDRLLAVFGGTAATAGGGTVTRPAAVAQPLIEPLSERELELLGLLAEGLANHEIAERLFIAPGTVKRHVHNILGKLDASDRVEAVAKARALGLL